MPDRLKKSIKRWKQGIERSAQLRAMEGRYREYLQLPMRQEALSDACSDTGRCLAVIAFRHPEYIALQHEQLCKYSDAAYIVFDNSPTDAACRAMYETCHARGISYVRLPESPYGAGFGSDSHGAAINRVTAYLRECGCGKVLFLDHDIFPFAPVAAFQMLERQPYYGVYQDRFIRGRHVWYLWPGYCALDLARCGQVDFRPIRGADTGSGMWPRVFRHADEKPLLFATEDLRSTDSLRREFLREEDGLPEKGSCGEEETGDTTNTVVLIDDSWLHMIGGYSAQHRENKFDIVTRLLKGGNLHIKPHIL